MATEPYHVLHLDDDESFLELTRTFMNTVADDIVVETTTDPTEALARVRDDDTAIRCLLTDYDMWPMNGVEVLQTVREYDAVFPVILYTGKGSEEIAAEAVAEGVTEYIRKDSGKHHALILANRVRNAIDSAVSEELAALRLEAIDAAREGIAIFHPDGTLTYANPAYCDLYGYSLDEAVGEPWTTFHPDHEVETISAEILPAVELSGTWEGSGTGVRKDDTEFPESKSISKLPDGGFVVIVLQATTAA